MTGAEVGDPPMVFGAGAVPDHVGWELSPARQHSGERSYFSTYADGLCTTLQTPPLDLTSGEAPVASFWTVFDIESQWDGGVVEYSVDGGASWSLLSLTPNYPSTFNNGSDACGYPSGHPSFSGTDLNWTQYSADLSPFAGGEILLRWVFSTDQSVIREGWYVDDVAVTHAQVPGQCSSNPVIFADGFESGDTSAWSAVVP
jgi:bacillopeptidase F (M6 metalloprotease family)